MAGNTPGSGFKATMTNELLIGEIKKVAKHDPALAQWLSAAVGGVVNKASGENANTGSAVASYATKWNEDLVWNAGVSNRISSLASARKGAFGLVKNASPVLNAGDLVSTPLVTGEGEPTTFDESTMASIPGTAFYRSSISAPVESSEVIVESTETGVGTVYNGPWVTTEAYPGTSLKVQLDYNLDSGFQPINVYHSPDGNTYQDNGKHDVINRRFFDGISIPGGTIYTGRFIGTDGTDNWIASQDKFNDPYIHIVNINSGETAILPYTKGDISIIDDSTDTIVRNLNSSKWESVKTGLPVTDKIATLFPNKVNPLNIELSSDKVRLDTNKINTVDKAYNIDNDVDLTEYLLNANEWNGKLKRIPKDVIDREGGENYTQALKRKAGKSKSDLYWNPKTGEVYAVPKKKGKKVEEPELLDYIPPKGE